MQKVERELAKLLPCEAPDFQALKKDLLALRSTVLKLENETGGLDKIYPKHRNSARNLLQYLAMRTQDVRHLQYLLSEWGLSSLGRSERKVQATLDTVLAVMHALEGKPWNPGEPPPVCFKDGRRRLEENTDTLLGKLPQGRRVRIMVTMPAEAANDFVLAKQLLESGMNCARINCAHDDEKVWAKIIKNIRNAAKATGTECIIHMDLGGPKLRTGPLESGPAILKIRPKRGLDGEVDSPARLWLYPAGKGQPSGQATSLPLPADWLKKCQKGDKLTFTDARGADRKLKVVEITPKGIWAEMKKTAYFQPGIHLCKKGGELGKIGALPHLERPILLRTGDLLALTKVELLGRNAIVDELGKVAAPAQISCTIPNVLDDVKVGEQVWFDDGKIGSIVEQIADDRVLLRITQTKPGGEKLRSEKGINLPDTKLRLAAITEQDLADLKFVVRNADMVGLSFANSPADVEQLIAAMKKLTKKSPAIVLKIETKRGFEQLPAMLLTAMRAPSCGVMIARGDLAIECGFGRLAEVQEQILWVCEAAHVPVIWATQVLEGLAKLGLPTRAEVTDAAMGQRAECIMLNKGEHIVAATQALDEILQRMQDHQTKKRSTMRKLNLAEMFFEKNSL